MASRRRTEAPTSFITPERRREITGIFLVVFAAFSVIALTLPTHGPLLVGLAHMELWMAGVGVELVPLACVVCGLLLLIGRPPSVVRVLGWSAAGLAYLGLLHLVFVAPSHWAYYLGHGGGFLGYVLTASLDSLVGIWGALLALLAMLTAGTVLATDISVTRAGALGLRTVLAAWSQRRRLNQLSRSATSAVHRVRPGFDRFAMATAAAPALAGAPQAALLPADPVARPVMPTVLPIPREGAGSELPALDWFGEGGETAEVDDQLDSAQEAADPVDIEAEPVLTVLPAPPSDAPLHATGGSWQIPPLGILESSGARRERLQEEIRRNIVVIEQCLREFNVDARVIGANSGPAVTQYELQPGTGVPVKRITALANDLALALAASPLRIEAPIPGKSAVGVEVPNRSTSLVTLKEVLSADGPAGLLRVALGKDVSGSPVVGDLTRMPHVLIAGAPGSGKSVSINAFVASLLMQLTPETVRLMLIDPKRVELTQFNNIPHLLAPVIVEPEQAVGALRWCVTEMDRRYRHLAAEGVRNIQAYNERAASEARSGMPYIVVIIDELADLMMVAAGDIEELVCRIAQLARAVGIHLVVATQRPSTDIVTGLIKANIPSRIAFAVSSGIDSRVVLDTSGAEKLLGRGDMLYQPVDAGKPVRLQGAFVSDRELEEIVEFWRGQGRPLYVSEVVNARQSLGTEPNGGDDRRLDPLFARAARTVVSEGVASVSLIQRKFNVGYSRAGRIIDQLADRGVVGGYVGSKSREVRMDFSELDDLLVDIETG